VCKARSTKPKIIKEEDRKVTDPEARDAKMERKGDNSNREGKGIARWTDRKARGPKGERADSKEKGHREPTDKGVAAGVEQEVARAEEAVEAECSTNLNPPPALLNHSLQQHQPRNSKPEHQPSRWPLPQNCAK